MSEIKRITFITSTDEQIGSTRLRVYKIANELKRRGFDVSINENAKKADVIIFQKSDLNFLKKKFYKYLLTTRAFIVYDFDDLYLGDYRDFVKFSDCSIAGSQYLKDYFLKYNKNIFVLDDIIDVVDIDIPLKKSFNLNNPKLVWYGNTTNLFIFEKQNIENVTKITRGGDIEWALDTIDENLQKFDLVLIPQDKTEAGLSKGNCRMLKALYLGIPALVSDLPAYLELAELVNYPKEFIVKDGENWNERIEKIKSGEIKFDFDFEKCRKTILENYSQEAVTNHWLDIISNAKKKNNPIWSHTKILCKLFFEKTTKTIFSIRSNEEKTHKRIVLFGMKIKTKFINDINAFIYNIYKNFRKTNKVCYSCITGGYDNVSEHPYINYSWDYILFTDNEKLIKKGKCKHWTVKPLEYKESTNVKNNRWHKTHPHLLLQKYDYSLYIDGNISIRNKTIFNKLKNLIKDNVLISIPQHPERDCIYDEAIACKGFLHLDFPEIIDAQMEIYKKDNYPKNNGLFENGIIFRQHNNQKVIDTMETWWNLILNYSKRDQLSFAYSAWKNNLEVIPLYTREHSHRKDKGLYIYCSNTHNHDFVIGKKYENI
ncbi:MAG: DUF616 domain-containing protein [Candidatus Gastranaerophilales bacterium]|nr:DUF616 domain-containing protein [Candidatus Gastranaerophilales bacterium]